MSAWEQDLTSSSILDCQGRVTHTLTLLLDGRVKVKSHAYTCTYDATTGIVDPPGIHLPQGLIDEARSLALNPFG